METKIGHWCIACLATLGAFFLVGVGSAFIGYLIQTAGLLLQTVSGFIAAFSVVFVMAASAPSRKRAASLCVFLIGVVLSYFVFHPHVRISGLVPMLVTWSGGIIGLWFVFNQNWKSIPSNTLNSTPAAAPPPSDAPYRRAG